ncbi:MAG: LolA family protein [Terriglobales bacterium]
MSRVRALLSVLAPLTMLAAQAPVLPRLVHTVDNHYNHLHSLQADFVEIVRSGRDVRTESGEVYLQKPGRMRWDYQTPRSKTFRVSGKTVWLYVAGEPQAQRSTVKGLSGLQTPLRLLLGHTHLSKEINGLRVSMDPPLEVDDTVLDGTPRAMADTYRTIAVEVTPAGAITRLQLWQVDGTQIDLRLTHVRENIQFDANWFSFEPPPGVEIVAGETVERSE